MFVSMSHTPYDTRHRQWEVTDTSYDGTPSERGVFERRYRIRVADGSGGAMELQFASATDLAQFAGQMETVLRAIAMEAPSHGK